MEEGTNILFNGATESRREGAGAQLSKRIHLLEGRRKEGEQAGIFNGGRLRAEAGLHGGREKRSPPASDTSRSIAKEKNRVLSNASAADEKERVCNSSNGAFYGRRRGKIERLSALLGSR